MEATLSSALLKQARRSVLGQFTQSHRYASTSSSYVPAAAYNRISPLPPRAKPALTTFFTGKPVYEDSILRLEDSIRRNTDSLRTRHIYPLPDTLAVTTPRTAWISAGDMSSILDTPLRTSQYRRVTGLLNELATLREIARRSGEVDVLAEIQDSLQDYERFKDDSAGFNKQAPDGFIDGHGRSVSKGRRKESSARVWMVRTKPMTEGGPEIPTTEVLVNSLPISQHFARPSDREAILRPLKLTGLLGAFNIFALTSGGGTTGQAGAIALAVARGIAVHRPDLRDVLQKDGALIRDPRMVERKKTGLAKARKRVSRCAVQIIKFYPSACICVCADVTNLTAVIILTVHLG